MISDLKPLLLIPVLLFLLPLVPAPAHSGESGLIITANLQYAYAEKLYAQGDYNTAQGEFKRFLHFFPDDSRGDEAEFKIASALYHAGQYPEAAGRLNDLIRKQGAEDRLLTEANFLLVRALLAMGNTGVAQLTLQNFLKLTEDPATRDRIYLELAGIHIRESRAPGVDSLDKAVNYLTLIRPESPEGSGVKYQLEAIGQVRRAPVKNPTAAGLLAVIPGGGFLYCERYKDAFVTFCLNAGLMYAAYSAFDNDNPALGGIISFVEAGFYAGNIYGSVSAAHKHNAFQKIKILDREFKLGGNFDPAAKSYVLSLSHTF